MVYIHCSCVLVCASYYYCFLHSSDMEELVRQEEDPNQSEEYIYLWEDWIALYSKIKINDLSKSIPTCKRYGVVSIACVRFNSTVTVLCSELPFLTSPKNFVDYCFDMFNLSIRSNPTDIDPETGKNYTPVYLHH